MNKEFIRNFALFVVILLLSAGTLAYSLVSRDASVDRTDDQVKHTHMVIIEAEQVAAYVEGMLAAQRGYIITGNKSFLLDYEHRKALISESIAKLTELTRDNPSQQSRLNEIRNNLTELTTKLEERAARFRPKLDPVVLDNVEMITNFQQTIGRINQSVLNEEYSLLNHRVQAIEQKKGEYRATMLIGLAVGTVLLLMLNGFLLYTQQRRGKAEATLKSAEDRFALAIDGTQDGIFDWDIVSGAVYYSGRFFEMLGYERKSVKGTLQEFKNLLHPDDADRLWTYVSQYLSGQLSEYWVEFRMKHNSGRWVWIQSRAKALFDDSGKAVRLVGAHTDISAMKQAQHRLRTEKLEAERANQAKTDFLAHMSHEIRTPLTAISGIAEILQRNPENLNEKQTQLVKTLASSSSSLKDLINDILDYSKIESGEIDLTNEHFSLEEVMEGVVSIMSLKASEKAISFVFDYHTLKNTDFYGDKLRLRQILINLAGNAIKFTDQGGVTINAAMENREGNHFLRVEMSDTGIGIAPENFDLVFERFKQADQSVSRRYGGTGLGLSISRNLARLMGGDIFLSSETGKGSTFTLILPFKDAAPKKIGPVAERDGRKMDDRLKKLVTGETKVLVVEDYEGNVVVVSYFLEDLGISYDVASNGVQALQKWESTHYDLILMDVQMPEMDGFAATREIRRLEKERQLARTPIIGMTAHALVGDKDKCIEVGMDAYLPKPLVEADLKSEILHFLETYKKSTAAVAAA